MGKAYVIGAVAGWLIVSMLYGKLLPALSLPSFLSVAIGGVIGIIIWSVLSVGKGVKKENRIKKVTVANDDVKEKQEYSPEVTPIRTRTKTCPDCAEQIRLEAVVCRYCGHKFKDNEIETGEKAEEIVPPIKQSTEIKKEDITIGIKKCPSCAEEIKLEARVCRYCGHHFSNKDITSAIQDRKSVLFQMDEKLRIKKLKRYANVFTIIGWITLIIGAFISIIILFAVLSPEFYEKNTFLTGIILLCLSSSPLFIGLLLIFIGKMIRNKIGEITH